MKKLLEAKKTTTFTFFSLAILILYIVIGVVVKAYAAPVEIMSETDGGNNAVLWMSVVSLAFMTLPFVLRSKMRLNIPPLMMFLYMTFIFCSIYLGAGLNFYFMIPHWDTFFHAFRGAGIVLIGFSVIRLSGKRGFSVSLSPAFAALFAFCLAAAFSVVWELFEFAVDSLWNINLQRFMLQSGEELVGRRALADTMKDFTADSVGTLAMTFLGYIDLKRGKGWLERFLFSYAA